jgi:hypothetical protein
MGAPVPGIKVIPGRSGRPRPAGLPANGDRHAGGSLCSGAKWQENNGGSCYLY